MNTPELPDGPPPNWPAALPSYLPAAPAPPPAAWEEPLPSAEPPVARALTPRTVLRAVRRHWWQILLIWAVASTGLVALIRAKVLPSYEAFALLQVEPPPPSPFGTTPVGAPAVSETTYMQTQVRLITSPDVLGAAIRDEEVAALPRVKGSLDPEVELRNDLVTTIIPSTSLVSVAMNSTDHQEAATIVNAVVAAYLEATEYRAAQQAEGLKREFEDLRRELEREVQGHKDRLLALAGQGGVAPAAAAPDGAAEQGVRSAEETRVNEVTLEEYRRYSQQLGDLTDEIRVAKLTLARLRTERPMQAQSRTDELEEQVQRALRDDPELAALRRAHDDAERQHEEARRRAVKPGDPARVRAEQQVAALRKDYWDLNRRREAELRDRLAREAAAAGGLGEIDRAIGRSEAELATMEDQARVLTERLKALKVQSRDERREALQEDFTRVDYNVAEQKLRKVEEMLSQLNYELQRNRPQISLAAEARPSLLPTSDNRLALMAAAPVGVLAVVLALFTLLELRAARVADPDDLTGRLRLGVIGVVPPLPTAARRWAAAARRSSSGRSRSSSRAWTTCGSRSARRRGRGSPPGGGSC